MGPSPETPRFESIDDSTSTGGGDPSRPLPLPECVFTFEAGGDHESPWRVRHFEATEGLSTVYECAIDLATDHPDEGLDVMLGRYALLQVRRDAVVRRFYGLVRRVEHRGATATHRVARAFLVPSLWLLSQRSDTRIFQGMDAVEVVVAVLRDAGLYADALEVRVLRELPKREYCVQYRETDLAFVQRLLESEGVTFFFRHESGAETLVLADGAHGWSAVRTMDGEAIPIAGAEMLTQRVEAVRHLVWGRELRPTSVTVRDFDFTRPDLRIERVAPRRPEGGRNLYEPAPALTINGYEGTAYAREDGLEQSRLRHESEGESASVGVGDGVVTGMIPGGYFRFGSADGQASERRYLVTRIEHWADAPEVFAVDASDRPPLEDRYRNRFRCVPVEVPFRPPRVTAPPRIAGLQTATVTGLAGEEIYTDEHGRIKVQFHWDRLGGRDERSSCWLRVMQGPWAGGGWGFQFLPRVGMEVAVSFLEGDPDRPVVVGALYNGQNRPPYPLPEERSKSAIKSQSTPGGNGYNELRFEDRTGAEEIALHAQRNLHEVVGYDHASSVGHDRTVTVGSRDTLRTGGHRAVEVRGDASERVEGDRRVTVGGQAESLVRGRGRVTVQGAGTARVEDDLKVTVAGRYHVGVLGSSPNDDESNAGDPDAYSVRVLGSHAVVASRRILLQAGEELTLCCRGASITLKDGEVRVQASRVVLTGRDEVVLRGATARCTLDGTITANGERVTARSAGAEIDLTDVATLRGAAVRLGSGGGQTEAPGEEGGAPEAHKITIWVNVGWGERERPGELIIRDAAGQDVRVVPESAATTQQDRALCFELDVAELPRPMTALWRVGTSERALFGPVDPATWYAAERASDRGSP